MKLKCRVGLCLSLICCVFLAQGEWGSTVSAIDQERPQLPTPTPLLFGITNNGFLASSSTLYRIDPATGAATVIGPVGFPQISAMDFLPGTNVLYATAVRGPSSVGPVLLTVNLFTGAGTVVGPLGDAPDNVQDISFRNSDKALFGYQAATLIRINVATGAATVLGPRDIFDPGNGIAFSPTDTLYHANTGALSTLNQTTGQRTLVAHLHFALPVLSVPRVGAMKFQEGTSSLYGAILTNFGSPAYLATINTTTGDVTTIGRTVDRLDAIAWMPVLPFDTCLQDDTTGNLFQFQSATGVYRFTRCSDGLTLTGIGRVGAANGIQSLTDSKPDRRVSAGFNPGSRTGSATLCIAIGLGVGLTFRINSTNPAAACACVKF